MISLAQAVTVTVRLTLAITPALCSQPGMLKAGMCGQHIVHIMRATTACFGPLWQEISEDSNAMLAVLFLFYCICQHAAVSVVPVRDPTTTKSKDEMGGRRGPPNSVDPRRLRTRCE